MQVVIENDSFFVLISRVKIANLVECINILTQAVKNIKFMHCFRLANKLVDRMA